MNKIFSFFLVNSNKSLKVWFASVCLSTHLYTVGGNNQGRARKVAKGGAWIRMESIARVGVGCRLK